MTMDELEQEFNAIQQDVREVKAEVESDAHMDFINQLRQYVNRY